MVVLATPSLNSVHFYIRQGFEPMAEPLPVRKRTCHSSLSYHRWDIDEGGAMYGRLVEIEGIDPSHREEILGILRERIIPGLKEFDGFAGFISLVDEDQRRARNVVLWETKESADEAESKFGPIRNEIVSGMGGTVRSADLFEAALVEVLAGVHA